MKTDVKRIDTRLDNMGENVKRIEGKLDAVAAFIEGRG